MTTGFHRGRFTWLAYILLAFYGYFLNVLGPITPYLKSELSLSYTVASLHFTAFAVGILLVGLFGNLLIQRLGRWKSLWVGAAGMSLSAGLLVLGKTPVVTIGASFLMGLIGSLILAIVPAALSEEHGDLRAVAISEANVVSSLVATGAPLLVGWFARQIGDWRLALTLIALTPILLYFMLGQSASLSGGAVESKANRANRPLPALFWIYWVAIVLAVSVEFCMISWSADFLETVIKLARTDAVVAVSLFLAAMIIGRWAGSKLVQYFSTSHLVTAFILLAGLGFLIFWKSPSAIPALVGLFLTGLGVASMYPLTLSLAIASAGPQTIQASARATLASGTAILILPLVLGRLADVVGIGLAYGVVALLLVCDLLIILLAGRIASARQVTAQPAREG